MAKATAIQVTVDGVRITRRAGGEDEQLIVLSFAEVAMSASLLRKHLLPLVPCEVSLPDYGHDFSEPRSDGCLKCGMSADEVNATRKLCERVIPDLTPAG